MFFTASGQPSAKMELSSGWINERVIIMGAKYTAGQAKATENYMKDKHTIRVVVPREAADRYKSFAESEGKSLSKFITDCVEAQIKGHP